MSERDTLLRTLPPNLHDDAERMSEDTQDPRDIVAQLHREGKIDAAQLKEAVVALESDMRIRHVAQRPPGDVDPLILGELGAGAMGEVLLAKDPGLNRIVAVKRIRPEAAQNKAMMRRFYTEAQVTAQLDHPAIVPIHGLVQGEDGSLAYAMKLVRGQTLEEWLKEARTSSGPGHVLSTRLERFLHVCDALAYAHDRGIVHRDLKPENIMVGAFGEVLVMDWGISKILAHRDDPVLTASGDQQAGPRATRVGSIMGTPRYMAPEQARGENDILDVRADQYSMGLILYEVVSLTEAMPEDLGLEETLGWAQMGKKLPMRGHDGGRPPRELIAIVDKATALEPSARYATISELAEDVRRYLRDEAPLAAPDGLVGRVQRWVGRHRRLAVAAIALLLSTVVIGGLGLVTMSASALAYNQMQAAEREEQLTNMMRTAMQRASNVDGRLHDFEALTHGIAYAAAAADEGPVPRVDFNVLKDPPTGRTSGGIYGSQISVDWASVQTATQTRPDRAQLSRLAALGPVMSQAMVGAATGDSRRIDSAKRARKLATGGPIAWAHVGYASGHFGIAPGSQGLKKDHAQVEQTPWFVAPRQSKGSAWSSPVLDPAGQGQVVTVSVPWFDDGGRLSGVAAMDVRMNWLIDQLTLKRQGDAYLLDSQGNLLARSGMDAMGPLLSGPLPHPEHASALGAGGEAGWNEASDGTVAVWATLRSSGWRYVVVAPFEELL